MSETVALSCAILRGGTSRGVFFRQEDLPRDQAAIERILLNVFGSPDIRQINGLGGATSQTSKAAIIGPSSRPDADVDYTFAQVSLAHPVVDWGGNCGNLSSAVGPFAIDEGLVASAEGITTVRIHNTNTGKIIVAEVPVVDGRAAVDGDCLIPGVPQPGARIMLEFTEPAGAVTGRLLPTGQARDTIRTDDGRDFTVSIVDAANPVVFLLARELGLSGTELPQEIERRTDATAVLEEIRSIAAEMLGIVSDRRQATMMSPGLPKVGFVAPAQDYSTTTSEQILDSQMDLHGRLMSMQTAHRSYMVTGAVCTGAAAFTEGTVVHEVSRAHCDRPDPSIIRIAHPYGAMPVRVRAGENQRQPEILGIAVERTARHILDGRVHVPQRCFTPSTEPAVSAAV